MAPSNLVEIVLASPGKGRRPWDSSTINQSVSVFQSRLNQNCFSFFQSRKYLNRVTVRSDEVPQANCQLPWRIASGKTKTFVCNRMLTNQMHSYMGHERRAPGSQPNRALESLRPKRQSKIHKLFQRFKTQDRHFLNESKGSIAMV